MGFEWDEAKRQANMAKHQIDFAWVQAVFDGRAVFFRRAQTVDEERFLTTGEIDGQFVTVVWTRRSANVRIISARKARDGEERTYRSLFGG